MVIKRHAGCQYSIFWAHPLSQHVHPESWSNLRGCIGIQYQTYGGLPLIRSIRKFCNRWFTSEDINWLPIPKTGDWAVHSWNHTVDQWLADTTEIKAAVHKIRLTQRKLLNIWRALIRVISTKEVSDNFNICLWSPGINSTLSRQPIGNHLCENKLLASVEAEEGKMFWMNSAQNEFPITIIEAIYLWDNGSNIMSCSSFSFPNTQSNQSASFVISSRNCVCGWESCETVGRSWHTFEKGAVWYPNGNTLLSLNLNCNKFRASGNSWQMVEDPH